jgi:hypothetical protein
MSYETRLIGKKYEEDQMKNNYDKDVLLKKYQEQNDEIIIAKRNCNMLM